MAVLRQRSPLRNWLLRAPFIEPRRSVGAAPLATHPRAAKPADLVYELRGSDMLVATTTDAVTALLLAREWLQEPAQLDGGIRTCAVSTLDAAGRPVGEHIVTLSAGPLGC